MTREELEAVVHAQITRACKLGPDTGSRGSRPAQVILAAADRYAESAADARLAGHVHDRLDGRDRLAQATAEKYGDRP